MIWQEWENAKGGVLAGGEYHLFDIKAFDNECHTPSEELRCAKEAYTEHGAQYMIGTFTIASLQAVAPFCQENKMLWLGWGAGWVSPDYPYIMGCQSDATMGQAPAFPYMVEQHPEINRVAMIHADAPWAIQGRIWSRAGARSAGMEIVYDELVPEGTTDFMPVVTAALNTEPNLIVIYLSEEEKVRIQEAARDMDYTGFWYSQAQSPVSLYTSEMIEYVDGKQYGSLLDFGSPGAGPELKKIYDEYAERHGSDEWYGGCSLTISPLEVLKIGIEKADSIDPTEVMNALYAMSEIDNPVFGKSNWGGMEMFGANHVLWTPTCMTVFDTTSPTSISNVATISIYDWWEQYKDIALEEWAAGGMSLYEEE